jgi:hypothetical protein
VLLPKVVFSEAINLVFTQNVVKQLALQLQRLSRRGLITRTVRAECGAGMNS